MSPGSSRVAGAGADAIPASLLAFAELHLRRAYDHAAREHRAAVASRAPGPSASADDDPADAAVDADAANPPTRRRASPPRSATSRRSRAPTSPTPTPTRRSAAASTTTTGGARAATPAPATPTIPRRRRARPPPTSRRPGRENGTVRKKLVPAARFHADAKSLALAARADWRVARAVLLTRELTARDAAERSVAFARRAAWRRAVITVHHQTLRDDVKRVTKRWNNVRDSNPPGDASPGERGCHAPGRPERRGDLRYARRNRYERRGRPFEPTLRSDRRRADARARAAVDATLDDDDDDDGGGGAEDGTRADADAATPPRDKNDTRPNDARFKKKKALLDYAEAAEEVGNRAWVLSALEWCRAKISDFVFGGAAARFAMKAERRAHHARFGRRMTPAEAEAVRARLAEGPLGLFERRRKSDDDGSIGGGDPEPTPSQGSRVKGQGSRRFRKPRLLDVGSCWDYFRRFRDDFDVVALDLCPRAPEVFRCDFSRLKVAPPTSDGGEEEEEEEEKDAAAAAASSPHWFRLRTLLDSIERRGGTFVGIPPRGFLPRVRLLARALVRALPADARGDDRQGAPTPRARGPRPPPGSSPRTAPIGATRRTGRSRSSRSGASPSRGAGSSASRASGEGGALPRVQNRRRGRGGEGGEGGEGPEGVRAPEIRIAFDDTPRAELGGADRARAEEEEALRREAEEAKQTRETTTTRGAK